MKKLITVENNQVVITDIASSEKTMVNYHPHVSAEWVLNTLTSFNISDISHSGYKYEVRRLYQDAGDELGISVAAFRRQLNGAMYRAYIKPNNDLHLRFSMQRTIRGWVKDPMMVSAVNGSAAIIREYIEDGISHLAGFGLLLLNSYSAKQLLGKGLWKKLARSSKTRNDIICKKVYMCNVQQNVDDEHTKFMVKFLNNTPSTILKTRGFNILDVCATAKMIGADDLLTKIVKHIGGPLCRIEADQMYTNNQVVSDTFTMIEQTGGVWNPNWSIPRIRREHDKVVVEQAKQSSTTTPFSYNDVLPNTLTEDEFTAELCKSHREMAVLGAQEHHCVGSYHNRAANGSYAVYKITDAEGVVSTLGISHPQAEYCMDQHYYAFNKHIKDEKRLFFTDVVKRTVKMSMVDNVVLVKNVANADGEDDFIF